MAPSAIKNDQKRCKQHQVDAKQGGTSGDWSKQAHNCYQPTPSLPKKGIRKQQDTHQNGVRGVKRPTGCPPLSERLEKCPKNAIRNSPDTLVKLSPTVPPDLSLLGQRQHQCPFARPVGLMGCGLRECPRNFHGLCCASRLDGWPGEVEGMCNASAPLFWLQPFS